MKRCFDVLILTRSSKYGGYCVAGLGWPLGRSSRPIPIRLVSDDEETHGALTGADLIMDNGNSARPLDVVRVTGGDPCPDVIQTENYWIDRSEKLQYVETITMDALLALLALQTQKPGGVFSCFENKMKPRDAIKLRHSLEMIRVRHLSVYTVPSSTGKEKTVVDFVKDKRTFSRFAMTDPNYYNKSVEIEDVVIICSVSEKPYEKDNFHHIFVAAILPISPVVSKEQVPSEGDGSQASTQPRNAGKRWELRDLDKLEELYRSGKDLSELAEEFGRTVYAIQCQLMARDKSFALVEGDASSVPDSINCGDSASEGQVKTVNYDF